MSAAGLELHPLDETKANTKNFRSTTKSLLFCSYSVDKLKTKLLRSISLPHCQQDLSRRQDFSESFWINPWIYVHSPFSSLSTWKQRPEQRQENHSDDKEQNIERSTNSGIVEETVAPGPEYQHIGLVSDWR